MASAPSPQASEMSQGSLPCRPKHHFEQGAEAAASSASAKHLIIMVNGIAGSATNWKYAADKLRSKFGCEVLVHCSACNPSMATFDGVDILGHRLAEEVKEVALGAPNLTRISFVGHSLGGLIARYAIGQLFIPSTSMSSNFKEQETPASSPGTILGLQPVNFIAVVSPHIGLKGNWQLPFLCGISLLERLFAWKCYCIAGRTGKHLFLADGTGSQVPLLRRMVSDSSEGLFISGLQSFQRRVAYANINYDNMVGWRTATMRREGEMPKLDKSPCDPNYPHIIHVEDVSADIMSADKKPALDPVEEEMISRLTQLSWQRVHVSFAGTWQCIASHSTIQVRNHWMHSQGADVVAHIVDNFEI